MPLCILSATVLKRAPLPRTLAIIDGDELEARLVLLFRLALPAPIAIDGEKISRLARSGKNDLGRSSPGCPGAHRADGGRGRQGRTDSAKVHDVLLEQRQLIERHVADERLAAKHRRVPSEIPAIGVFILRLQEVQCRNGRRQGPSPTHLLPHCAPALNGASSCPPCLALSPRFVPNSPSMLHLAPCKLF